MTQPIELWRPIVGWESLYSVSSHGRVMRTGKGGAARPGTVRKMHPDGCGYLRVALTSNYNSETKKVHRLVAEAFIGPIPDLYTINHKDGNKTNNHVDNLEIVTRSENLLHLYRVLGRNNRGENNPKSKLTLAQVAEIREALSSGARGSDLARMFGVTKYTISDIKRGESWA